MIDEVAMIKLVTLPNELGDPCFLFQSSDFGKETFPYSQMFLAFQRPYGVKKDLLVTAWKVFAWFEEVFGSIDQIMYLTYHSR